MSPQLLLDLVLLAGVALSYRLRIASSRPNPKKSWSDSLQRSYGVAYYSEVKGDVMAKARIRRLALLMGVLFALWMTAGASHLQWM
jgi:hypothetical protein